MRILAQACSRWVLDTTITDCTFNQNTGNVVIDTGSDIVSIENDVTIDAGNNITIGDSTISATPDGSDADISTSDDNTSVTISSQYGDINLSAAEGNVVINNSTLTWVAMSILRALQLMPLAATWTLMRVN